MNTYERERLQLIREKAHAHPHNYHSDFHFLLSLYDSQAEFGKRFAEKTYVGQYDAVNDAATRMRDLCVAKVRAIPMPTHLSESGEEIVTHFRARVVRYLESLTLDSVHRDSEPEGANR